MATLKYPCEHAFHVMKDRLIASIKSALQAQLVSLDSLVQKIDYRASFGPYICEETFNVFDEFEQVADAVDVTDDFVKPHEAKAAPKITDFFRMLGHDEQRATENLIYGDEQWLIAWPSERLVSQNEELPHWAAIDNAIYTQLREQKTLSEVYDYSFNTRWNLGEKGKNRRTKSQGHEGQRTKIDAAVSHAHIKAKVMLRHPESNECLGTLTFYMTVDDSQELESAVTQLADVLFTESALLQDIANAYAEMRELRRLALQKLNLSKVSRYLFKQKTANSLHEQSDASPSTPADHAQDKPRRFLPRIIDATNTVLSFLGQYAQARHVILFEVYDDAFVDIYQTWSSTFEDTFAAERLQQGFAAEMQTERQFLQDEISKLQTIAHTFSSEVFTDDIEGQKFELNAITDIEILSRIFSSQDVAAAPLNQQSAHQIVLPNGLSLRAVEHVLSSNEVFGGSGAQVKWYIAFIDREDNTVDEGCLHRWNLQASNGEYLQRRMQSELTHAVEILANELTFYLRSYKDQCKQYVWSNERLLTQGEAFGLSSLEWLNWLGDFLHQRVVSETCEFYLPAVYCRTSAYLTAGKYPVKPLTDLFDVIFNDVDNMSSDSEQIEFTESDWAGILRLVNTPERSILFVSIGEKHRHKRSDTSDSEGYATQWSVALTHTQYRYSYVHLFLLEKIVRQVARVRRQAIKSQFQEVLSALFHHENALDNAIKEITQRSSEAAQLATVSRDVPKEYLLAENILTVLQERMIKPFIGLELPMMLATQNTTGHVIHMASNRPLNAQFELDDDALFTDGKATLRKLLTEMHQRDSHKMFKPGELVMARPERGLQAGRYALAIRLELLSGHLFDGILLVMGRHNRAFDQWTIKALTYIARSIVPILSISCINHQTHAQMGLFQHAVNSPVQGIISNAKSLMRLVERRIDDLQLANEKLAHFNERLRESRGRINRNAEQIRSWKRSLQALFGNVRVDLSKRHNLSTDIKHWVDRYREFALSRGITLHIEQPKFHYSVTYDAERMDIAFSNVLDNAIKYSADFHEVLITVTVHGATVAINVSNYGPYIDETAKERLMSFGQRSKLVAETMIDGQGIGLPVVHAFVQAHPDGALLIHSEKLKNNVLAKTSFTIRFRDNERDKLT